jgi:hypothetical protein
MEVARGGAAGPAARQRAGCGAPLECRGDLAPQIVQVGNDEFHLGIGYFRMPPRFAYWTILVDNQPTAFRAKEAEELLPTFNRLKEKHPSAVLMWFQGGRLWRSRLEAHEAAVAARREAARKKRAAEQPPRDRKWRPGGAHRDPRQKYKDARKAKWTRFKQRVRQGARPRPPGQADPARRRRRKEDKE